MPQAGVVIHGTFILSLPVETKETIEETDGFQQSSLVMRAIQPDISTVTNAGVVAIWPGAMSRSSAPLVAQMRSAVATRKRFVPRQYDN